MPKVGDVVLYHPHPGTLPQVDNAPLAGTIAGVLPNGLVNLGILDANGNQRAVRNVMFYSAGPKPVHTYCEKRK